MTEDRGQITEVRGQITEVRRQRMTETWIGKWDPSSSLKGGTMPRQACGRRNSDDRGQRPKDRMQFGAKLPWPILDLTELEGRLILYFMSIMIFLFFFHWFLPDPQLAVFKGLLQIRFGYMQLIVSVSQVSNWNYKKWGIEIKGGQIQVAGLTPCRWDTIWQPYGFIRLICCFL